MPAPADPSALPGPDAAPKPRTKPAAVRLDELMAAAEALFIQKGVEAATINEIVERAGVAKGTFYHYFTSKNDMLAALRAKFSQGFLDHIDREVQACAPDDGVARLRAWTRAGVEAYFDGYELHDVVFHDAQHPDRGVAEKSAVLEQLEAILEAGARAGCWQLEDAALTAIVLYHGMHGAVDASIAQGRRDAQALSGPLSAMFLRTLGAG
ncbi:bacterial regulatory protein, TetR family protein 20 [Achromobacter xylosoxidans A8]|uniref:Bacterial regulatory protein, TetR family protein 20 n=1 Tax=Achromobacter xylosoxidans (strain A8) TaxID=762376 RepID=E3HX79_ACHXA|nr:TetR/AcrR family transcriptional regulator [Achromobacter xylosoxidans]ADP17601.1 bacterial regulatory protein, TetR family protein 20 [Achromobacter xylosoxidans A8]